MSEELKQLIKATLNYFLREKLPLPSQFFIIILLAISTLYRDDEELLGLLRKAWRMSTEMLGQKRFHQLMSHE